MQTLTLLTFVAAGIQADAREDFSAARTVLEQRCLPCHGGDERESGLSFADASTFAAGGSRGAVVLPGDLGKSRLYTLVSAGAFAKFVRRFASRSLTQRASEKW